MKRNVKKSFFTLLILAIGFLLLGKANALTEQWQADFLPNTGTSFHYTLANSVEANNNVVVVVGHYNNNTKDCYLVNAYDAKTGKLLWIDDANYISPDYTVVGDYAHSVSFSLDGKRIFVQVKLNTDSGWRYVVQVYEATTGKVMGRLYYTGGVNPTKTCVNNKSHNFILYANWQSRGASSRATLSIVNFPQIALQRYQYTLGFAEDIIHISSGGADEVLTQANWYRH